MGQEWYYSRNGQKHGPVSGADLKQLAAAGKLLPTDHVWKEGMEKWVPVRSVKGLIPAAQAPVATAVPPPPPAEVDPLIPAEAIKPAEVVEAMPVQAKAPLQARVRELLGSAKKRWPLLSTPAKVGIVGGVAGGVLLLLLLFCILPLTWFFGGSSGTSSLSVRQIVQAYVNDPAAANKKFKDKTLTVEGGKSRAPDASPSPGKLTREQVLDEFDKISGGKWSRTFFTVRGKQYLNMPVNVKYETWTKRFGPISSVEEFFDEVSENQWKGSEDDFVKAERGKWIIECTDGPIAVIGVVTTQKMRASKTVSVVRLGYFR